MSIENVENQINTHYKVHRFKFGLSLKWADQQLKGGQIFVITEMFVIISCLIFFLRFINSAYIHS